MMINQVITSESGPGYLFLCMKSVKELVFFNWNLWAEFETAKTR